MHEHTEHETTQQSGNNRLPFLVGAVVAVLLLLVLLWVIGGVIL